MNTYFMLGTTSSGGQSKGGRLSAWHEEELKRLLSQL